MTTEVLQQVEDVATPEQIVALAQRFREAKRKHDDDTGGLYVVLTVEHADIREVDRQPGELLPIVRPKFRRSESLRPAPEFVGWGQD